MEKKKTRLGRPPKDPADRYQTPARQLGRVQDADWAALKAAAKASGKKTFIAWALPILMRAAKRQLG